jgi:hypothetical protein
LELQSDIHFRERAGVEYPSMRNASLRLGLLLGLTLCLGSPVEPQSQPLSQSNPDDFGRNALPLLSKYCFKCHGAQGKPKADLNLVKYATEASVRADRKTWKNVLKMLSNHEMPPEDAKPAMESKERELLAKFVETALNKIDPNAPLNPGRSPPGGSTGRSTATRSETWWGSISTPPRTSLPTTSATASTTSATS